MKLKSTVTRRLVKSEDLNHHRTLFFFFFAERFVESSFIVVATYLPPKEVVCLKIHGMEFLHPIHSGDVLTFESKIAYCGKSSLTAFTRVYKENTPDDTFCEGFATFIHVDEHTVPRPHGIVIEPKTPEDLRLYEEARNLVLASRTKK
jgi:acyl-CoA hydrolase